MTSNDINLSADSAVSLDHDTLGELKGKPKFKPLSIGREKAIALAQAKHWEGMTHRERAEFQLNVCELTMPFDVFHEAVQKALGRPVFTHEFGLNWGGLVAELRGDVPAPSLEEVLELIPADKRVVIAMGEDA
ncbi:hypothetical protein [Deinococcus sp. QL22]|uniref:DUF7736 domain-containing protein n=1 Tax=Deinococcus sp. QL22 TaxID=2939437 RepID=UPI00201745AA|nr:hypothetical protein [Deinococcus sp. QL22]UQN06785.1 hypothetical protein M1R55_02355 [Deinococcus sp. QL22]